MASSSQIKGAFKIIKPEACKLLGGELRRKIIDTLRGNELTISIIAKKMDMTPQAIYHHLKKLENAGLIQVTREVRRAHLIESYYQVTAENFIYYPEEVESQTLEDNSRDLLKGLNNIGFKIETNEENVQKLVDILTKQKPLSTFSSPVPKICSKCSLSNFFVKSGPINLLKLDYVYHYANLLNMTDEEYKEKVRSERKIRNYLLSICKRRPEVHLKKVES
jgi:DNA-binding transcriptional ArsR family regulator